MNGNRLSHCLASALLLLAAAVAGSARGDVIELANGGRISGQIVESPEGDKTQLLVNLSGGGQLTIPRSEVKRVGAASLEDAEYQKLARTSPDTIGAHWSMVEWCREHKMIVQAQQHLARILELDPNDEKARAALGFRQQNGQWMTRDDVMASRGLVRYEGQYVTPQHVALMQRHKETKVTRADWANNLERLRRALTGRREDRAAAAHAEIVSIRDPMAAEAVVAMLHKEEDPDLRRMWIEVASQLDHRASVDALVDLSLTDPDPEIRHDCLEYLVKSRRPGVLKPYVRALRNSDNEIVNRAGAALGQIGDPDAIAPLIESLMTRHKFRGGEGNADQHAYTFSPDSGGFSFGGGGPKVIHRTLQNPDVLGALVALSGGASFDYDQDQWRRWLAAQAKVHAVDVRRDQ